jgi:predicted solute-binding protein
MNILRSWREQKILLKRRFQELTDDDFVYEEGEQESMLMKLATKLGLSRQELAHVFEEIQLS